MSRLVKSYAISIMILSICTNAQALANRQNEKNPERGWYFYEIKKQSVMPRLSESSKKFENNEKPKTLDSCSAPKTWQINCGFQDPTTMGLTPNDAFKFEQKQYKALMQSYALYPNNVEAVYNFQKFNTWAINQAMTASYTWQYNLAQHPEIDANIQVPVSQFGIRLIKDIQKNSEQDFWNNLSETSFFVLITRTDNKLCQGQGTIMHMLENDTGMTVWNLSMDDQHLPSFNHFMNFSSLEKLQQKAITKYLKMDWLPTIYLYMKPSNTNRIGQWVRVTSGITTLDEIKERTIHFVEAYKHAIITGVGDKKEIKPNFSANHLYQLADDNLSNQNKIIRRV